MDKKDFIRLVNENKFKKIFVITGKNSFSKSGANKLFKFINKNNIKIKQSIEINNIRYKSIILGKEGRTIKMIRKSSQEEIEDILNKKIHLYIEVVYLNANFPLKNINEIMEGIHTLTLHNFDKVISVYEDFDLHFVHSKTGLEALAKRRHAELRIEREALFVDNRAFSVCWSKLLSDKKNILKSKIGHVVMPRDSSYNIRSKDDLQLIKHLLKSIKK